MYEQNANSDHFQENPHRYRPNGNMLATTALICAILGIVSVCCLYGAFVFGGLAIVFGLLSRGSRKKTFGPARTAIWIGTIALIISAVITAVSFVSLIRQYGSLENLINTYTYTLEKSLGIDPEDSEDTTPGLFDENNVQDWL